MSNQELQELCKRVVNRGRSSAEEKAVIAEECKARGIELNTRCPNCYIDAAALIFSQLNVSEVREHAPEVKEQAPEEDGRKYVLRSGVNVLCNGVHVCEATITDELAEKLVAVGFPLIYFAKYPQK